MSEETNGKAATNGRKTGGLAGLLSKDRIGIPINGSDGYSGLTFYFEPMDPRTDRQYTHILQRGGYKAKNTSDEAVKYVFNHKFSEAIFEEPGQGAEEDLRELEYTEEQIQLFRQDPKRFFLTMPEMWHIVRTATNGYLNEVFPEVGESKRSR
jgi:hypothetical protein